MLGASSAGADDTCATFFWTGSNRAAVERYKPHYLIGAGLEDVGMGHIIGSRIRNKWSEQAAQCFSSTNSYGYFFHEDFETTECATGEACFPGTRHKKLSERLADVRNVVEVLSVPNANPIYQSSLQQAKAGSFLVVASMENAKSSTVSLYQYLATQYGTMINQLSLVVNLALPPSLRTQVMDEVCAEENVAQMDELLDSCYEETSYCDLYDLYDMINACTGYTNGEALDGMLSSLGALRTSMIASKTNILAEKDAIEWLWNQIISHQ